MALSAPTSAALAPATDRGLRGPADRHQDRRVTPRLGGQQCDYDADDQQAGPGHHVPGLRESLVRL